MKVSKLSYLFELVLNTNRIPSPHPKLIPWTSATLEMKWAELDRGIAEVRYQRKHVAMWENEGGAISEIPVESFVIIDSVSVEH